MNLKKLFPNERIVNHRIKKEIKPLQTPKYINGVWIWLDEKEND